MRRGKMQRVYNFVFRFLEDNNVRSNTIFLFVVSMAILYEFTCGGSFERGLGTVYRNRAIWTSQELCDWCTTFWDFAPNTWCAITGWFANWWVILLAILYWFFARRDDVHRAWTAAVGRFLRDHGGRQDLPDHATGTPPVGTPSASQTNNRALTFAQYFSTEMIMNFGVELLEHFIMHRNQRNN